MANAEFDGLIGENGTLENIYDLKRDIVLVCYLIKELEDEIKNSSIERVRQLSPTLIELQKIKSSHIAQSIRLEKEIGSLQPITFTMELVREYRELIADAVLAAGLSIESLTEVDEKFIEILQERIKKE
jgi:hypothetical protein